MRQKKLLFLWLLLLFSFTSKAYATDTSHIVSSVDVLYRQGNAALERTFYQPEKMEVILNYLRLLDYAGMPEKDPELYIADSCRITVWLHNGNCHIYHLRDNRYLSRDYRPWEQVESPRELLFLLKLLPTDKKSPVQSTVSAPGSHYFLFLS